MKKYKNYLFIFLVFAFNKNSLASFSLFEAKKWSFWDTIQLMFNDIYEEPKWSDTVVLYRMTDKIPQKKNNLDNVNTGNFIGQLSYINNLSKIRENRNTTYYLKSYHIKINTQTISDYYHCIKKKCSFKLSCLNGPCVTNLKDISNEYKRVGIKEGIYNLQLSRCNRPFVCYKDICPNKEESLAKLNRCKSKESNCFFSFTGKGLNYSYKIEHESEAIPFTFNDDYQKILEKLETI